MSSFRVMSESGRVQEVQRLFVHHADLLEGFIVALLPDFSVSKDILHEVFLTVTAKAEDFRPGSDFVAWARTISRMKVFEHLRRKRSVPHLVDPLALEAVLSAAPEGDDAWARHREALARCLDRMSPRAREILEMRYSEPLMAPREIARRISWTSGAVRVALARARRFLHECARGRLAGQEV